MVALHRIVENMHPDIQKTETKSLVCVPNWLGDSIMSMPALTALKSARPNSRLTVLVKEKLRELWRMHPAVDAEIVLPEGLGGVLRAASEIRRQGLREAYVLPNSFRAALVPFFAGVPERVGQLGHRPGFLLTHIVDIERRGLHQGKEYLRMLGLDEGSLELNTRVLQPVGALSLDQLVDMEDSRPLVGMMPGAARGPSKQWPSARYVEVGRWLAETGGCRVCVFGTAGEAALCEQVASGIGEHAENLAGKTSLNELVGLIQLCQTVVCNDSGGMHLAAAAGVSVVAVFGLTDPNKTGPLGRGHKLIFRDDVPHQRDVKRDSQAARNVLASIEASSVIEAVSDILYDDHE